MAKRAKSQTNVLNLGAGNRIINGAINHDIWAHRSEIAVEWDLNCLPWPWNDNSFDKIVAWAVFEHLDIDLLTAINECWRILRPNGILDVKLPWCHDEGAYNDPTHRYAVGRGIFDIFDQQTLRGQAYQFYRDGRNRPISTWKVEVVRISDPGTCVLGVLKTVK